MHLRHLQTLSFSVILLATLPLASAQTQPNERGAWEIWEQVAAATNDHVALRAACLTFEKENPADPLQLVVRGIRAWSLLKTDDRGEAVELLQSMLIDPTTPTQRAGVRMARTWLTRLDREAVRVALNLVYRREIEFPETLAPVQDLPPEHRPPMTDRWGQPWNYALVGFKFLEGFNRQKYRLESPRLGDTSELDTALEQPYAAGIPLRPVQMTRSTPGDEMILFVTADEGEERVMLSPNVSFGDIALAYIGTRILILSDGNHWKFTARPR